VVTIPSVVVKRRPNLAVKPIPEGYRTATPYLIVAGAAEAIAFYKKAFGAVERGRMDGPGGRIMHAEFMIGDSIFMITETCPEMGGLDPKSLGGSPVTIHLYVEDVDTTVSRAVEVGAKLVRPVVDQFYGDRSGVVEDPFGHSWNVGTHVEDVTPEQMKERFAAMMAKMAA